MCHCRREVFLPYQHVNWLPGCQPHPGNIVEPASLAVIESTLEPDGEDISESLPKHAITTGSLSSLQLESVIKAVSTYTYALYVSVDEQLYCVCVCVRAHACVCDTVDTC